MKIMISQLEGKISYIGGNYVVLSVAGIGYKIFSTLEIIEALTINKDKEVFLWTHHVVREDAQELYGFIEKEDLDFFELLIKISGIGPKGALGILSVAPTESLKQAIASGDKTYLTKVSGIGRKTAEKIILELRERFEGGEFEKGGLKEGTDALAGLQSLGYTMREAREALKQVPAEIESASEKIKSALKILGQENNGENI